MEHQWVVEEVDGGPIGIGHFYECSNCLAGGGPVGWRTNTKGEEKIPAWEPFFPGTGIKLPADCEEARKVIAAHKATREWQMMRGNSFVHYAKSIIKDLEERYGVKGTLKRRGGIFCGIPTHEGERATVYRATVQITPDPDVPDKCGYPGWTARFASESGAEVFTEATFRYYIDLMSALQEHFAKATSRSDT